jgi:cbb3-type cytochrome oxidase maturation protein
VSILFVLIPLAVLMLAVALAAFFWAVGHDQFDDLETPGVRVLFDDAEVAPPREADSGATRA